MLVKICGITTVAAAKAAVDAGADMIGFVFTKSKRQLTPEAAAQIAAHLPKKVKKVGVFVNSSLTEMEEIAEKVGLDVIQLHGDEDVNIAKALPYEVIKAFPAHKEALVRAKNYPANYLLIDTPSKLERGGSGEVFNWELLSEANLDLTKVILAGGLNKTNVQAGISIVNPAGVDVSSGVETEGEKDLVKIKAFIETAKRKGR